MVVSRYEVVADWLGKLESTTVAFYPLEPMGAKAALSRQRAAAPVRVSPAIVQRRAALIDFNAMLHMGSQAFPRSFLIAGLRSCCGD